MNGFNGILSENSNGTLTEGNGFGVMGQYLLVSVSLFKVDWRRRHIGDYLFKADEAWQLMEILAFKLS